VDGWLPFLAEGVDASLPEVAVPAAEAPVAFPAAAAEAKLRGEVPEVVFLLRDSMEVLFVGERMEDWRDGCLLKTNQGSLDGRKARIKDSFNDVHYPKKNSNNLSKETRPGRRWKAVRCSISKVPRSRQFRTQQRQQDMEALAQLFTRGDLDLATKDDFFTWIRYHVDFHPLDMIHW